jgi:predicted AAA+ superfamily ATPase
MKLCAGRTGQLLNMHAISNECGVAHNTVKSWLSVLEESGIVQLMNPWHANIGKRLVKSKKLFFLDTGFACLLLGIHKSGHLNGHPLRGALFETLIVSECYKQIYNAGQSVAPYFYRDNNGCEVDLLFERGADLNVCEIKSAMTVTTDFFRNMRKLDKYTGRVQRKTLIYAGERECVRDDVQIVPWRQIAGRFLET